jgi:hypothetical protein
MPHLTVQVYFSEHPHGFDSKIYASNLLKMDAYFYEGC